MDETQLGQHRPMLCRFLRFLLGDPHEAEDLAQETFRVALATGADPQKGSDYGAWLRSIARNLVRNHARRLRRRPLLLEAGFLEQAARRFVHRGADRDEAWEARRQALTACLERLAEADRDLLRRRYEGRQKVRLMAAELGIAPNTLSKRLERIRQALRQCIEARLKGEPHE